MNRIHSATLLSLAFTCLAFGLGAASPETGNAYFEIDLKGAEDAALQASSSLRASGLDLKASEERSFAAWTYLWPRLALDASDRYNTVVPEVKLNPKGPAVKFGDNNSYSLGVGAAWTLWDSGNAWNLYRSLQAGTTARQAEYQARRRELLLKVRMGYFQAQLMAERTRVLADSLKLAQSQSHDIEVRLKAGASSRIDSLSARNEVLQRRAQYRQSRADLAAALRDLFALTALGDGLDPSVPALAGTSSLPADTEAASLSLKMQSLEASLEALQKAEAASFNPELPQLAALKALARAARMQGDALASGHWPRVQLGARASLEYPNGPVLETIQQNSFNVSASWPIFAFGQISHQVKEQEDLAAAADARSTAMATELRRDWLKSHDRLKALKDQKSLDLQAVKETEGLLALVYRSYQNGSSSLLEVQTASLRALETKVRLASTQTQMLIELAVQSSLSE
ncbi:MAG: TolC family protein [candidate division FCPU426 bacterium]